MKKTEIIVTKVRGYIHTPRPPFELTIFEDGAYLDISKEDIVEAFGLEEFYFGNLLQDVKGTFSAFNTYNYNAPIVLDGAVSDELEFAVVNLHRGGDPRGNYTGPYYVEGYEAVNCLVYQSVFFDVELSTGALYRLSDDMHGDLEPFIEAIAVPSHEIEQPLTAGQLETLVEVGELVDGAGVLL